MIYNSKRKPATLEVDFIDFYTCDITNICLVNLVMVHVQNSLSWNVNYITGYFCEYVFVILKFELLIF